MIKLDTPLRDSQEDRPVCRCPKCGGEVDALENLFEWDGKKLCSDCFKNKVRLWLELSPEQVANALGFDFCPAAGKEGTYGY